MQTTRIGAPGVPTIQQTLTLRYHPLQQGLTLLLLALARSLRAGAHRLDRLVLSQQAAAAARVMQPSARPRHAVGEAQLEFSRRPGDPAGTVYLDGERLGSLPGVTRL